MCKEYHYRDKWAISDMYIVVAVHSQDSMRLAFANAVLAVHCNYFVGSS